MVYGLGASLLSLAIQWQCSIVEGERLDPGYELYSKVDCGRSVQL